MRQLDQVESFVVTRRWVPVGELSPLRRHLFVSAEAAVAPFNVCSGRNRPICALLRNDGRSGARKRLHRLRPHRKCTRRSRCSTRQRPHGVHGRCW
jgi:hypothetical protein